MARRATPNQVERQYEQWTNDQLLCRSERHRFTIPVTAEHNTRYNFLYIVEACEGNCGVVRRIEMTLDGHIYWRSLDYSGAKNYLMKDAGRITGDALDEVRRQKIVRITKPKKSGRDQAPHQTK